jgi:uncharacterized repeat protein (TIGR02543 family)
MRGRVRWGVLVVLTLVLGVSNAAGRVNTVTLITVEVVGKGTVTSNPGGINCGQGNTTCYVSFTGSGPDVTLTADPADGWTFERWGSTTDTDPCPGNTCTIHKDGHEHQITANFSKPSGSSTKTLSVSAPLDANHKGGNVKGGDINCGSDLHGGTVGACSWTVPSGSVLTVRQTPDSGFVFNGWSGACTGTNVACTVQMSDDQDLGATWNPSGVQQLLTVTISGLGSVTGGGIDCTGPATCTKNEPSGSTITLKAKPKEGFVLSSWGGDCGGTADTCTVTMNAARSVTATFVAAPLTLSVIVNGNGNVSGGSGAINCGNGANVCSASFAQDATVTLIATPATGGTFVGWTGACGGTATTCTILMSDSKSVTAIFTGGTTGTGLALSVSVSGSGTVSGGGISCGNGATICSVNLAVNSTVTLTATPAAGATFNGWGGDCSGTDTTCTVFMNAVKSVTASFSSAGTTFLLAVSVSGSGTVTGGGISCGNGASACSATLPAGTTVTLTATPAAGATFSGWNGACGGTSSTCTVTMTSAQSVTATFTTAAPGTLTIIVNGKGTVSTRAGKCIGTGAQKTCVQHLRGKSATLTETPAAGQVFGGWGDACASASKKVKCTVTLTVARVVSATFTAAGGGGGGGGGAAPVLTSRGLPIVRHTATGFRVTLRFNTTRAGLARVRGLRAGRALVSFSLRVAAGPATIGPFQVTKPGLYTFEVRLGTRAIHWRSCLGRCGRLAPGPSFVLTREAPKVTRSGDVWSVTLHLHANLISAARVQAFRGTRKLVDQRFLARSGQILVGPFLLGPGSYTLRLTATDAYGRTRTLTWIVSLAR